MTDAERYTTILLRYRTIIWRLCFLYASSNADRARDLVQEVSLALWEHFGRLRPDADERDERKWVYRRTLDVLRTLRRRERRQPHLVPMPDFLADTLADGSPATGECLEEVLALLDPDERHLVRQLLDGYTAAEVALDLGIATNAVYQRTYRIVKKLKTHNHAK